ncbi:lipocalin family protein [Achromobacter xylosoxidans]|uniref:Outer membrane lipoprotein Blc n=1 Tax=Alcaligenes xylosoxydans xylosoxydans TaxID=85698 RepID=A0A0X8P2U2_ALCXX|nr:lipocalin family protein [Achromobacter xylosoxidans]AMG38734.1 hypothetical protein AL504_23515 [Achromobacter xylosoxidans]
MLRALCVAAMGLLTGCAGPAPMPPVAHVDLSRFMGDWYVIAHIPSWPERNAYDAVESYRPLPDGRIQTDFRYRKGSFDAEVSTMHPVATVRPDSGNAVWGMQFIWPIQAEYVIAYLDDAYQTTIIGRSKRDYVWIMARVPCLSEDAYAQLAGRVAALGYTEPLRKVPQRCQ